MRTWLLFVAQMSCLTCHARFRRRRISGWPDIFNTGLMVLNPNMGDYYALLAMAQRGISFDGADQGLLNMYFRIDV